MDIILYPVSFVLGLSAMIIPTALIFGITMPFINVLVRYRANYSPKEGGVRLPDEVGNTTRSGNSYFGMMKRVHRIEGWSGLYKGLMPSIVTSLIAIVVVSPLAVFLALSHKVLPNGRVYMHPQDGIVMWIISLALSIIPALLLIPMQIITNRAITTPHTLSSFDPSAGLRALLSPAERTKPLILYAAPGVALSETLQGLVAPALGLLRLFVPRLYISHRLPIIGAALPVILLTTALLTPLQVMSARLTLQRRAPETATEPEPYQEEAVMEFRSTEEAPYTSLFDCARKIVQEEGAVVLTRAWWITALLMVMPMLAAAVAP